MPGPQRARPPRRGSRSEIALVAMNTLSSLLETVDLVERAHRRRDECAVRRGERDLEPAGHGAAMDADPMAARRFAPDDFARARARRETGGDPSGMAVEPCRGAGEEAMAPHATQQGAIRGGGAIRPEPPYSGRPARELGKNSDPRENSQSAGLVPPANRQAVASRGRRSRTKRPCRMPSRPAKRPVPVRRITTRAQSSTRFLLTIRYVPSVGIA